MYTPEKSLPFSVQLLHHCETVAMNSCWLVCQCVSDQLWHSCIDRERKRTSIKNSTQYYPQELVKKKKIFSITLLLHCLFINLNKLKSWSPIDVLNWKWPLWRRLILEVSDALSLSFEERNDPSFFANLNPHSWKVLMRVTLVVLFLVNKVLESAKVLSAVDGRCIMWTNH